MSDQQTVQKERQEVGLSETVKESEEAEILHGVNPDSNRSELTIDERLLMLQWEECEVWDGPTARIMEVIDKIDENNTVKIRFKRENGDVETTSLEWPDRYSDSYKIVKLIEDNRMPFELGRLDTTSLKDVVVPIRKNEYGWTIRLPNENEPYGVVHGTNNITKTDTTQESNSGLIDLVMAMASRLRWKKLTEAERVGFTIVIMHIVLFGVLGIGLTV